MCVHREGPAGQQPGRIRGLQLHPRPAGPPSGPQLSSVPYWPGHRMLSILPLPFSPQSCELKTNTQSNLKNFPEGSWEEPPEGSCPPALVRHLPQGRGCGGWAVSATPASTGTSPFSSTLQLHEALTGGRKGEGSSLSQLSLSHMHTHTDTQYAPLHPGWDLCSIISP